MYRIYLKLCVCDQITPDQSTSSLRFPAPSSRGQCSPTKHPHSRKLIISLKKSRAALAFCVRRAGSIESQRLWVFSARRVLIPLSVAPWAPLSAVTARRVSRRGRGQLACPDLEWRLCGPMIFPTRSSHWPIFWKTISPTSRIPQPFSPRLEAEDKTGFKMSVAGLKKQFYKASQVCKTFLAVSG